MRRVIALSLFVSIGCSTPPPDSAPATVAVAGPAAVKFDPSRDPAKDLEAAVAEAGRSNRRIVLDVGGEWCSWCHILDKYIEDHPDVKAAIARDFVWLKINYSPENQNAVFLSKYPAIDGYPHLFVLETDGTLLHSQNTEELEAGNWYDLNRVRAFLERWGKRAVSSEAFTH